MRKIENKMANKKQSMRKVIFLWEKGNKIGNIIQFLSKHKSLIKYKNDNFTSDKLKIYEAVHEPLLRFSWKNSFSVSFLGDSVSLPTFFLHSR